MQSRNDVQTAAVELRGVSLKFGETAVLDGLDLRVISGETVVLLGESGCGKTTTLRLINGLADPTDGAVLVEGKPVNEWDRIKLRRRVGYVLQDAGLFPHFTVGENVALIPRIEKWDDVKTSERTLEMLGLVGLDPGTFADRFPHELSGGQRQRVAVARALAADPGILLLDEPFGALDPITRTSLQKEFARLVRNLGKTAVLVTHDLRKALLLGDRIALMDSGKIVVLETADGFQKAEHPLAKAYLDTVSQPD